MPTELEASIIEMLRANQMKLEADTKRVAKELEGPHRDWRSRGFDLLKHVVTGVIAVPALLFTFNQIMKPLFEAQDAKIARQEQQLLDKQDEIVALEGRLREVTEAASADLVAEVQALGDRATRDAPSVERLVALRQVENQLDTLSIDSKQVRKPASGSIYVGEFSGGTWKGATLDVGGELPVEGKVYQVTTPVNVRKSVPSFPFYRLSDSKGTYQPGDRVEIIDVSPDVGANKVWAEVRRR